MKRVCFLKFEGVLENYKNYLVDLKKAKAFTKELSEFCKKNKIDLYLISGLHEKVAKKSFEKSFVKDYFNKKKFLFVTEDYISSKAETDEKLHRDNLEKDEFFVDSFFKQSIISKMIKEKELEKDSFILLCNDVWVDGYYTMRFSQIDFAIFENNVCDRDKKIEKISGLAYFNFDFDSVKKLLEDFPVVDYFHLDKYVFEVMKEVIMKDVDFSALANKASKRRNFNGNN
jgi:hypothetical protein